MVSGAYTDKRYNASKIIMSHTDKMVKVLAQPYNSCMEDYAYSIANYVRKFNHRH